MGMDVVTIGLVVALGLIIFGGLVMLSVKWVGNADNGTATYESKIKCVSYDCDTGNPSDSMYKLCCGDMDHV